jgi:hypothetical protein
MGILSRAAAFLVRCERLIAGLFAALLSQALYGFTNAVALGLSRGSYGGYLLGLIAATYRIRGSGIRPQQERKQLTLTPKT